MKKPVLGGAICSHVCSTLPLLLSIIQAQKLATEGGGGDWDRRNRLKVYRGLARLLERDIKGTSAFLIDCIATFSCNEICSYQSFIVYAIMSNLLHLPRPQIKEKLLDGPEVLSIAADIPEVVSEGISHVFQSTSLSRILLTHLVLQFTRLNWSKLSMTATIKPTCTPW
jgi:hypothetical protein